MKILGIAGYSGAGKTTLIEALLPRLNAVGLTVSVIKQSHHDIQADAPGKDSWRHRQAGAQEVLLTSPHRWMLVNELRGRPEPPLHELIEHLSVCDLVLVEGYRHERLPKIEVWRRANGQPWLHPLDVNIIAVACDEMPPAAVRYFSLDDADGIAVFVSQWIQSR